MKDSENNTPATSTTDTDQYEDRRQYLEREESTTSYPIIGDGYSDAISVVSDITTPTVMPGQVVPVEELYDAPPPMHIDFNRKTSKSKARSFASSGTYEPPSETVMKEVPLAQSPLVLSNNNNNNTTTTEPTASWQTPVPKLSGAAAKRRQNHQQAMAQLESSGQRSLLGKSNQYAVSISASVQKMSISSSNNNNETGTKLKPNSKRSSAAACDLSNAIVVPSGNANTNTTPTTKKPSFTLNNTNDMDALMFTDFTSDDTKNAFNATTNLFTDTAFHPSGFPPTTTTTTTKGNTKKVDNFFDFGSLDSTTSSTKQSFNDAGSFDSDGFPMGGNNSDDDPFAISTFTNDFPNDAFQTGGGGGAFATITDANKASRDPSKKKRTTTTNSGRRSSTGVKSPPVISDKVKKTSDAKHDTDEKLRKKRSSV
jgi:hypothetical protein